MADSNIDQLKGEIGALIGKVGFNMGGLGRALVDKIAWDIGRRSINFQQDGDGVRWTPNATEYAKWKLEHYGSNKVGAMTGQMLSIESLKGEATITNSTLTMTYGTDKPSEKGSVSNPPKGKKKASVSRPEPTDREKAAWFEAGDESRGRDPRAFYELDDAIEDDIDEIIGEYLERLLSS